MPRLRLRGGKRWRKSCASGGVPWSVSIPSEDFVRDCREMWILDRWCFSLISETATTGCGGALAFVLASGIELLGLGYGIGLLRLSHVYVDSWPNRRGGTPKRNCRWPAVYPKVTKTLCFCNVINITICNQGNETGGAFGTSATLGYSNDSLIARMEIF